MQHVCMDSCAASADLQIQTKSNVKKPSFNHSQQRQIFFLTSVQTTVCGQKYVDTPVLIHICALSGLELVFKVWVRPFSSDEGKSLCYSKQ